MTDSSGGTNDSGAVIAVSIVVLVVATFLLAGVFVVNPNEAKVLQLFGDYVGTVKNPGLRWANPFYTKKRVSQRVRNFESAKLKVNDNEGNPIEIASVVVWRVVDTAEAVFEVDDYNNYVKVQTESALRNLATSYTYDAHDDTHDLAARHDTGRCGSPEEGDPGSAVARGRRGAWKRASAISPTRRRSPTRCCSGSRPARSSPPASGSSKARSGWWRWRSRCSPSARSSTLDNERRAAMVSNLLVVLCGDKSTQPIINTGTIYQ